MLSAMFRLFEENSPTEVTRADHPSRWREPSLIVSQLDPVSGLILCTWINLCDNLKFYPLAVQVPAHSLTVFISRLMRQGYYNSEYYHCIYDHLIKFDSHKGAISKDWDDVRKKWGVVEKGRNLMHVNATLDVIDNYNAKYALC